MKSSLNIKILKLCISEICVQIGFDRISEQSLNILSDILKHYLSQIVLRLNKALGSNAYFEHTCRICIDDFIIKESYRERELFSFLKSQIALKKSLGDSLCGKSLLHTLKILPNDQTYTGAIRSNSNEIDPEPNLKTNHVTDSIDKDGKFTEFLEHCNPESFRKRKMTKFEYDFTNILDEVKKKKNKCDHPFYTGTETFENKYIEVYNDLEDIFNDFSKTSIKKVFRNYE